MPGALLIIGIHKEELVFGEQVAHLLAGTGMDVLKIENGLSNRRPTSSGLFIHTTRLREIYMQVLGLVGQRHDLVVDLHTGVNDEGRCADVYCANTAFLEALDGLIRTDAGSMRPDVRLVQIIEDRDRDKTSVPGKDDWGGCLVCTTLIPSSVWKNSAFLYVGLEVYIQRPGIGTQEDWRYAAGLIGLLPVAFRQRRMPM